MKRYLILLILALVSCGPTDESEGPVHEPESPVATEVYYQNCSEVPGPIDKGDPGYRSGLDRDNDGIACNANLKYPSVTVTLTMEGVYVDSSVHPDWEVERGIELWNDALPCEYFYISDNPHSDVTIVEVYDDSPDWWGDYNFATGEIRLNSRWERHWIVPAHELGHALGAPDMNTPEDLMFVGGTDDPLPTEITERDLESINEDLLSCP